MGKKATYREQRLLTRKERGTFNDACERAATYANRHGGVLEVAEHFLDRSGWSHATFGIVSVDCVGRVLRYLDTGDTYSLTLGQEDDGDVFTTTWGDWYKQAEREHCEAEGVISCGCCGEFTPLEFRFCESCGRPVSTGE